MDNFNKGSFELSVNGKKNKAITGRLVINDGNIKTTSFVQFLNTISSLLSSIFDFSISKLSQDGFDIESGFIDFDYIVSTNELKIKKFRLNGVGLNIIGNGHVDLTTKKIDFQIDIMFLKGVGNIIGNIPIIGDILLGDNKNFALEATITGTYEEPEYHTHTIESLIKAPLNIIQRFLTSPIRLFE
jgi:hypothetical protein